MAAAARAAATDPRWDADRPPQHPDLHAKHQALSAMGDAGYWRQLCPQLHVGDAALVCGAPPIRPGRRRLEDIAGQVNEAGVVQVEASELPWSVDLQALADGIVTLVQHGWPPSMIVVYDEVWVMVRQASLLMQQGTGGNACNMDILAWLVDPNRGDVGFSPHRDRQPDDSPATFRPDGSAMYATCWVPLTHATPDNSCLYVIPRPADPGYFIGDPEEEGAPDPLAAALTSKEAYQAIRALPAAPGAAVVFTHRTIHWGSQGRRGHPTPRISLSWGCADDAFEPPYFSRAHLPDPPLALRLALAGAQMIIYHERFPAPPKQLRLYYKAFMAQADQFDPTYRAKVLREFVDASKEAAAATAATAAGNGVAAHGAAGNASKGKKKGGPAKQPAGAAGAGAGAGARDSSRSRPSKQLAQQAGAGSKRSKATQAAAVDLSAAAAAAAAAAAGQEGATGSSKKRQKRAPAATPAAADAADHSGSSSRKRQQRAPAAAAAGQRAAGPAAAPPPAADSSGDADDDEDEGPGIDFALLAAQAKQHKAAAAAAAGAGNPGKKKAAAAAAAADGDSEDGDDVLDLALECMLEGPDGDFVDDYED